MDNKLSKKFFAKMAKNNPDEKSVKITSFSDFTDYDVRFIEKYVTDKSNILDLASGSGLIVNKLYEKVAKITAVELFEDFSKFIVNSNNIEVINKDIQSFETNEKYDIITMFGIIQYFNEKESIKIFEKYINYINPGGKFIIKGQFGVSEDVVVSGFSEELGTNYYSQYRHLEKEINNLESLGLKIIEVSDIYPPECNRWDNTHFHAIVAEKV